MEEFQLEPGEKITVSVRKHWLVLVAALLPYLVLAYLPILLINGLVALQTSTAVTQSIFWQALTTDNGGIRFVLGTWWLLTWMGAFSAVMRYFLTVWVITTIRIVDIQQYGFFRRQVSSLLLNRVQDVTTDVEGLFETLFGFGRLNVESAGALERFTMSGIRDPNGLRDLIMREVADLKPEGTPEQGV